MQLEARSATPPVSSCAHSDLTTLMTIRIADASRNGNDWELSAARMVCQQLQKVRRNVGNRHRSVARGLAIRQGLRWNWRWDGVETCLVCITSNKACAFAKTRCPSRKPRIIYKQHRQSVDEAERLYKLVFNDTICQCFLSEAERKQPKGDRTLFSVSFWKIGLSGLSYWQWPETLLITQPCNTMSVATASNKRRTSLVWVADFVVLSALGHAVHRVAFDSSRSAFSWLNSTDVSAPAAFCCQRKFAYRWKHLPLLKRSLRQFSDLRGTFRWDSCQL